MVLCRYGVCVFQCERSFCGDSDTFVNLWSISCLLHFIVSWRHIEYGNGVLYMNIQLGGTGRYTYGNNFNNTISTVL